MTKMNGYCTDLTDSVTGKTYRTRLMSGNLYVYEWITDKEAKRDGWYLLSTVIRNGSPEALDTTTYYEE